MCISCPEPHYKPRHSIPRCKIRQKIREISHFPQFIMVSAPKLLIINSLAQSQRYRAVCFTRLISIRPIRAKVPSPGHYPGLQRAQPIRPERAKAPSPGHHPGLQRAQPCRPERAKAFPKHKLLKRKQQKMAVKFCIVCFSQYLCIRF